MTGTWRPGRSSSRSPGGRCPCSTRASRTSTSRCAAARGSSTSATWVRSRPRGPDAAGVPAADPLQRRLQDRRERGAVQRPVQGGRRRPRRSLHLQARREPLPDGHQRGEPREGPRVVHQAGRGVRRHAPRRAARLRDARGPGAGRARDRRGPGRRRAAQALPDGHARRSRARPNTLVCGTGYTGEDGVELLVAPEHAAAGLGRAGRAGRRARGPRRARHAAPGGLLPPLRQRPDGDARPDRGRPRVVREGGHGLHRRAGDHACSASAARPSCSCRSRIEHGIARQGNADPRRRRGHVRHAEPVA